MMKYGDFHVHSTYCDGKSTLRETVEAAIAKGLPECIVLPEEET